MTGNGRWPTATCDLSVGYLITPRDDEDDPVIEFLVRHDLADRLRALHLDDGTGHCRQCTIGGQLGRLSWPCRIHDLATRAAGVAPLVLLRIRR